jgi:hypothetical protein
MPEHEKVLLPLPVAKTLTVPGGAGPDRLLTVNVTFSPCSAPKVTWAVDSDSPVNVTLRGWIAWGADSAAFAGPVISAPAVSARPVMAARAATAVRGVIAPFPPGRLHRRSEHDPGR